MSWQHDPKKMLISLEAPQGTLATCPFPKIQLPLALAQERWCLGWCSHPHPTPCTHTSQLCTEVLVLKMLWAASVTVDGRCYSITEGPGLPEGVTQRFMSWDLAWKCSDVPACPSIASWSWRLQQNSCRIQTGTETPPRRLWAPWPRGRVQLHWHPPASCPWPLLLSTWLNRNWKFLFRGKNVTSVSSEILLHVVRCSHFKRHVGTRTQGRNDNRFIALMWPSLLAFLDVLFLVSFYLVTYFSLYFLLVLCFLLPHFVYS